MLNEYIGQQKQEEFNIKNRIITNLFKLELITEEEYKKYLLSEDINFIPKLR